MSGKILDLSTQRPPRRLVADVAIIGSGPAGAVAARGLAQAGLDVVLFEEGPDRRSFQLTQRDAEMYDQLYVDRGGRTTSDLGITILQGRALGGGTVINACDVVPMPDSVPHLWQRRYGLSNFSPEALAPDRTRALEDVSASTPAPELLNENNRKLRDGALSLGMRGEVMMHNRVGCAGVGACLIGCPLDAKRNARTVILPQAVDAGARVFVRARIVRIGDATREVKILEGRSLDPAGYHERDRFEVRAKIVVLAANAVGSAALLLRSGVGNAHVGRHLLLQPQLPVTALFDGEVRAFRGIPQSYAVTEFEDLDHPEHGWWGFRIEAIGGTPGIVASLLPSVGTDGKRWMSRYPRLASALLLTPDAPTGRVRVERNGRLRIDYALSDEQRGRFRTAVRAAARIYLAAGARAVVVPSVPPIRIRSERDLGNVDALGLAPATAPLVSAHQQGGVRMAPSARDGAADPEGRVYGARDVYVFDSAGFPTSSSSHTMIPILTVAGNLTRALVARLG